MAVTQTVKDPVSSPRTDEQELTGPFKYPDRIHLTRHAERYLHQLGLDLAAGVVELRQLPPSLVQFYVFAYQHGACSRQPEVDQANWDADRLYAEVCRRPPARDHQTTEEYLAAQKHRGKAAAAQRAADIRALIGGNPSDRYPDSGKETE